MALVDIYFDPAYAGADDDGTESKPWSTWGDSTTSGTLLYDINEKVGTDGNSVRINCKKQASRWSSGTLSFGIDCTATELIYFRGYETTIGDGGLFELTGPLTFGSGDSMWIEGWDAEGSTTGRLADIFGDGTKIYRCRFVNTNASGEGLYSQDCLVYRCYMEAQGDFCYQGYRSHIYDSFIYANGASVGIELFTPGTNVINCVVRGDGSCDGISGPVGDYSRIHGNRIYNCDDGIFIDTMPVASSGIAGPSISNNIIYSCNYGIRNTDTEEITLGLFQNAIGNCTSGRYNGFGDTPFPDDITLTADPFTDSANGDFSLNDNVNGGALCRAVGMQINEPYDYSDMSAIATFEGTAGGGSVNLLQGLLG